MGTRRFGRGRDDQDLLHAQADQLVEQTHETRRSIAQAMGFPTPVGVGGENDGVGLRRHRHGQRGGDRIDKIVPAHAAQIDHLRPPQFRGLGRRPPKQIAAARLGDERKHQVAMGVEVVREDHELAESRLPQIVRQHLRVSLRQIARGRLLELRRAAEQIPQDAPAAIDGAIGRQRRRHHPPPRGTTASPAATEPAVHAGNGRRHREHQKHQPRKPRRQRVRRERRLRHAKIRVRRVPRRRRRRPSAAGNPAERPPARQP